MKTPKNFKALAAASGLSTPELAALFGKSARTIKRWRASGAADPAAMILLGVIADNGLAIISTQPAALQWLAVMVESMRDDGLQTINRRLGIGYGTAARLLDGE